MASWRSGDATDCKSVYTSSILVLASNGNNGLDENFEYKMPFGGDFGGESFIKLFFYGSH